MAQAEVGVGDEEHMILRCLGGGVSRWHVAEHGNNEFDSSYVECDLL